MPRRERKFRFLSFAFIFFYRSLSNVLDKFGRKRLLRRLPQRGILSIPCLQLIVFQQLSCSATGRLAKCVSEKKKYNTQRKQIIKILC